MRLVYQRDDLGLLQARFVPVGRSLPGATTPVREIVGSVPPVLTATDRLVYAAQVLQEEAGALPVRYGGEVGILSEHDVARAVADGLDPKVAHVGGSMTREVVTVTPDVTLIEVARIMVDEGIRHIVIVHRETPIAVVSVLDVLAALLAETAPRVGA